MEANILIALIQEPNIGVLCEIPVALTTETSLPVSVLETLVRLLQVPDSYLRSSAISTLNGQESLPVSAIDVLVVLLEDQDSEETEKLPLTLLEATKSVILAFRLWVHKAVGLY